MHCQLMLYVVKENAKEKLMEFLFTVFVLSAIILYEKTLIFIKKAKYSCC
jgi:hypothetical protein